MLTCSHEATLRTGEEAVTSPSPGLRSSLVGARDRARQLPRTDLALADLREGQGMQMQEIPYWQSVNQPISHLFFIYFCQMIITYN